MNQILVFGAGRSSLFLIEYLAAYSEKNKYNILVCDKDVSYAEANFAASPAVSYSTLDIFNTELVSQQIQKSALVVSLLPATLHIHIAKLCLEFKKHLATASYISDDMKALHQEAKDKDLIFLNEMGLDPGIDHMSAMEMMDNLKREGANITGFSSYTGGLVADADDGDNPWKYKFTWNPRNVVLAAQGPPAVYLENQQIKLMPYHQIFANATDFEIKDYGILEGYPNRDSLKYIELYGLQGIKNMLRGTFRKQGYCKAWNVFVSLGMTDDQLQLNLPEGSTLKQWMSSYIPGEVSNLKAALKAYCQIEKPELEKIEWLGFFNETTLPLCKGSSAQILEEVLKEKWVLEEDDKDLVVMLHQIQYTIDGEEKTLSATMVLEGETASRTAMAKSVGTPLAIGCKLILENKLHARGVIAPLTAEIYTPVLEELYNLGIQFKGF